jgi:hypothetical protein
MLYLVIKPLMFFYRFIYILDWFRNVYGMFNVWGSGWWVGHEDYNLASVFDGNVSDSFFILYAKF